MLYLHDVWVNWSDGEENEYNVYHFHEWKRTDKVELLDQVPLLKVSVELFDSLTNSMNVIPAALLKDIKGKAYMRKNHDRIQMNHCFCVTDGVEVMAIDAQNLQIPLRKSRLIPRQSYLAFEMSEADVFRDYPFENIPKSYDLLCLPSEPMRGLTRKERNLKQLLGIALEEMKKASIEKVRYYLTEWEQIKYTDVLEKTKDELLKRLTDGILKSWSKEHEEFLEKMIRNEPELVKLYEIEMENNIKTK